MKKQKGRRTEQRRNGRSKIHMRKERKSKGMK